MRIAKVKPLNQYFRSDFRCPRCQKKKFFYQLFFFFYSVRNTVGYSKVMERALRFILNPGK